MTDCESTRKTRRIIIQLQKVVGSGNPVNEGNASLFTAHDIPDQTNILSLVESIRDFVKPKLDGVSVTDIKLLQGKTEFDGFSTMLDLLPQTRESPSPLLVRYQIQGTL